MSDEPGTTMPPRPPDAIFAVQGRRLAVWYRAGAGEDLEIRRMRGRASEAEHTGASSAGVLRLYRRLAARVIEAWDLRDEEGQPVPITAGALQPLPLGALQRIVSEATGRRGREGQPNGVEQDDEEPER